MNIHPNVTFVSVIIPTFNRCDLLENTIKSIFKQSYPADRYEIIIVDNSSTDGTEEMVQSLQHSAPTTLKYYRKANEGPGTARNIGVKLARGDIIAFTDSDCVADVHWIEHGVAKMSKFVGLVQGKTLPNKNQTLSSFSLTQNIIKEDGLYQSCNIFYRKQALDDVRGFSADFCGINMFGSARWGGEDTDLAWRVKKHGWMSAFADDAIIYHHVFYLRPWEAILAKRRCLGLFHLLPLLLKKHPELRNLLYRRYFLNKTSALFDLFFVSVILGIFIHKIIFVLTVPYIVHRTKGVFKGRPLKDYHHGLHVLMVWFLSDLSGVFFLVGGSIWRRSVIL